MYFSLIFNTSFQKISIQQVRQMISISLEFLNDMQYTEKWQVDNRKITEMVKLRLAVPLRNREL